MLTKPFIGKILTLCIGIALTQVIVGQERSSIFNQKDLAGWRVEGKDVEGHWTVVGEQLIGENKNKTGSNLWTKKDYADFDLELEYKTTSKDYDTGVFARAPSHQIQIGISRSLKRDMTGCIYAPKDKKGSYPGQTPKVAKFHRVGEWNKLRIMVRGNMIHTYLNDEPFVSYDALTIPARGPIGLQLHANVHMKIQFRNLTLKELGTN